MTPDEALAAALRRTYTSEFPDADAADDWASDAAFAVEDLRHEGYSLVPTADLDRLRAVEAKLGELHDSAKAHRWGLHDPDCSPENCIYASALGDRAAEHDRQSAAGTHLYDESCPLCGDRAAKPREPGTLPLNDDNGPWCGCGRPLGHAVPNEDCTPLGDRAEEEGRPPLFDLFATQLQETGHVVGHRGDERVIAMALDAIGAERFEVTLGDWAAEEPAPLDEDRLAKALPSWDRSLIAQIARKYNADR